MHRSLGSFTRRGNSVFEGVDTRGMSAAKGESLREEAGPTTDIEDPHF
jgi:hypothetical protein